MVRSTLLVLLAWGLSIPLTAQSVLKDLDPLVVEVLDPAQPENGERLRGPGLPILFRGMRPQSLEELQQWMRLVTASHDPDNQNKDLPPLTVPGLEPVHPSNRMLIVRCDPGQDVAWVHAVLAASWLLPGKAVAHQVRMSPLIPDVRIGLRDIHTRDPATVLRTWRPRPDGSYPPAEDLILTVVGDRSRTPAERLVTLRLGNLGRTLGTCTGWQLHRTNADGASFAFDPRRTPFQLREDLGRVRKTSPTTQVRLLADPRTPFVFVHEMLQIVFANELAVVMGADLSAGDLDALVREGRSDDPLPVDTIGAAPSPDAPGPGPALPPVDGKAVRDAVDRGLAWLERTQERDGRWRPNAFKGHGEQGLLAGGAGNSVGVTGLALLAFLENGFGGDQDKPYHRTVTAGVNWLCEQQDVMGCFGSRADPHFTYAHAAATQAMAVAAKTTGNPRWKLATERAVAFALQCQNPYKAWRYGERPGDNDTSVTTWMLLALDRARAAGVAVPPESLSWALEFLDVMTDPETGRTGYTKRGEPPVRAEGRLDRFPANLSESLTAGALLGRMICGEAPGTTPQFTKGLGLLNRTLPEWRDGKVDMIYWSMAMRVFAATHADGHEAWRRHLAAALLPNQIFGGPHDGAFPPAGAWGEDGGAVYSTALMTIALGDTIRP